jgi:hypothetical protein
VLVRCSNPTSPLSLVLTTDGGEVTRQGHLDSLIRSFPVRTLTRRELTQFIVVVFLDGICPLPVFWLVY